MEAKIMNRCDWCSNNEIYIDYHDKEWGVPQHNEEKHFEFLVLECFQAGLNWLTILKKRENFRLAFDNFDPNKISKYKKKKIKELLNNDGIIRNKNKINATINNAGCFLEIQKEFGSFDTYIWKFVNNKPIINKWKSLEELPAKTELSDKITKDLKKRGFKFVGSITIYAHIQAIGLVNDHLINCFRHKELL